MRLSYDYVSFLSLFLKSIDCSMKHRVRATLRTFLQRKRKLIVGFLAEIDKVRAKEIKIYRIFRLEVKFPLSRGEEKAYNFLANFRNQNRSFFLNVNKKKKQQPGGETRACRIPRFSANFTQHLFVRSFCLFVPFLLSSLQMKSKNSLMAEHIVENDEVEHRLFDKIGKIRARFSRNFMHQTRIKI